MVSTRRPSGSDNYEYLLRVYFGSKGDYLARCIDRAYLDFCRTLDGIQKFNKTEKKAGREPLIDQASAYLKEAIADLKEKTATFSKKSLTNGIKRSASN